MNVLIFGFIISAIGMSIPKDLQQKYIVLRLLTIVLCILSIITTITGTYVLFTS